MTGKVDIIIKLQDEPDPTTPDPVKYFKACIKTDRRRLTETQITDWMKISHTPHKS